MWRFDCADRRLKLGCVGLWYGCDYLVQRGSALFVCVASVGVAGAHLSLSERRDSEPVRVGIEPWRLLSGLVGC